MRVPPMATRTPTCVRGISAVSTGPRTVPANYSFGGKNYLLQKEWVNQGGGLGYTGGKCAMSYTGTATPTLTSFSGGSLSPVRATPEPISLSLFGAGFGILYLARRRGGARPPDNSAFAK